MLCFINQEDFLKVYIDYEVMKKPVITSKVV